jgi:WD40 repeat protein
VRPIFLSIAVLVLFASTAQAEIRVIDPATGASTTLVAGDGSDLLRWTDDGAALLIRDRNGAIARVGLDGSATAQPQFVPPLTIGPGGRMVGFGPEEGEFELRGPDGRVLFTQRGPSFGFAVDVTWSVDGSRVAIGGNERLLVLDTATGGVLLRSDRPARMTDQAFAADGSWLAVTSGDRVLRIEIPSGRATRLYRVRGSGASMPTAVSSTGQLAVTRLGPIVVPGGTNVPVTGDPSKPVIWSPDGATLAVSFLDYGPDRCSPYDHYGLGVVVPGQFMRVLIESGAREVEAPVWSPDGGRLAVELGPDWTAKRGDRHAWPKRIARDFGMRRAADAAARQVVLRASRSLRQGASRETVMDRVRLDNAKLEKRFREARRGTARQAITTELDRWLRAAGFEPTEGSIEIVC